MSLRPILLAAFLGLFAHTSNAAIIVTAYETGGDVVISGSGTFDITGLGVGGSGSNPSLVQPNVGAVLVGGTAVATTYNGLSGPLNFGAGTTTNADSSSGDIFGINRSAGQVYVPTGFTSGALSGTSTYNSTTLSALGMVVGTYDYNLTNGQTFQLQVVPEPSTYAILGVAALAGLFRLRRAPHHASPTRLERPATGTSPVDLPLLY